MAIDDSAATLSRKPLLLRERIRKARIAVKLVMTNDYINSRNIGGRSKF